VRIAVIGDPHGSGPGFDAVVRDLEEQRADVVIGTGDYLNTGPGAERVVAWMRSRHGGTAFFVRGDNDEWENYEQFRRKAKVDQKELYRYTTQLPHRLTIDLEGVVFRVEHAPPLEHLTLHGWNGPALRHTVSLENARTHLDPAELAGVDVAIFGGLHMQHLEADEQLMVLLPGSAGANWPAEYALVETDAAAEQSGGATAGAGKSVKPWVHVTHRTVEFDREAAVAEMRAGYVEDPGPGLWLARRLYGKGTIANEVPNTATPFKRYSWRRGVGLVGEQAQ
jgi:predicted phosphodiesterase